VTLVYEVGTNALSIKRNPQALVLALDLRIVAEYFLAILGPPTVLVGVVHTNVNTLLGIKAGTEPIVGD